MHRSGWGGGCRGTPSDALLSTRCTPQARDPPTSGAIGTPMPGGTAQQSQTRRCRAIPRSPGSRAEETSGAWTGWRNLQVLEGGRRKPKGGLGFPQPLLLLLLAIFPNRSLPLPLSPVGSPTRPKDGLRHSLGPKDRPEKSSRAGDQGGLSQGQISPQHNLPSRGVVTAAACTAATSLSVLWLSRTNSTGAAGRNTVSLLGLSTSWHLGLLQLKC